MFTLAAYVLIKWVFLFVGVVPVDFRDLPVDLGWAGGVGAAAARRQLPLLGEPGRGVQLLRQSLRVLRRAGPTDRGLLLPRRRVQQGAHFARHRGKCLLFVELKST